jgi:hypothetical protein
MEWLLGFAGVIGDSAPGQFDRMRGSGTQHLARAIAAIRNAVGRRQPLARLPDLSLFGDLVAAGPTRAFAYATSAYCRTPNAACVSAAKLWRSGYRRRRLVCR